MRCVRVYHPNQHSITHPLSHREGLQFSVDKVSDKLYRNDQNQTNAAGEQQNINSYRQHPIHLSLLLLNKVTYVLLKSTMFQPRWGWTHLMKRGSVSVIPIRKLEVYSEPSAALIRMRSLTCTAVLSALGYGRWDQVESNMGRNEDNRMNRKCARCDLRL